MRLTLIDANPSWLNGENNKAMLAKLASRALLAACSPKNIRAWFKKTSIYPFNHLALDLDFGPSMIFEEAGESSCSIEDDLAQGEDMSTECEGESVQGEDESAQGDVASLEMDDANAEEEFSQQLSQLSIEEDNPKTTRLMDMYINLVVPLHMLDMMKAKAFFHIHPSPVLSIHIT